MSTSGALLFADEDGKWGVFNWDNITSIAPSANGGARVSTIDGRVHHFEDDLTLDEIIETLRALFDDA